ncbi:MAG TPA: 16S rRNA (uracil(1498)-N(3))-methyltransferase [Pyrinomonadaceae bacterium]
MTARRRFFAPPNSFDADRQSVTIPADETRHLRDVLRIGSGDVVFVFDGVGNEYECIVSEPQRESTRLNILSKVAPRGAESPLQLTLALALLKGEKFDLVIQKTTELGVQTIIPIATRFADVRIKDKRDVDHKVRRWQRIALEAAKQCGRARVPMVSVPTDLSELLGSMPKKDCARLLFSERLGQPFEATINEIEKPASIIALVGSEGGWADEEIEHARASGWKILTLSGRTLRAETAAIAVTALLQHRLGDLN